MLSANDRLLLEEAQTSVQGGALGGGGRGSVPTSLSRPGVLRLNLHPAWERPALPGHRDV